MPRGWLPEASDFCDLRLFNLREREVLLFTVERPLLRPPFDFRIFDLERLSDFLTSPSTSESLARFAKFRFAASDGLLLDACLVIIVS